MSWALLIVEDEPDIREELTKILDARGFRAIAAANGVEALDVARQHGIKPSIVLLDLVMPLMDGLEFLERQHDVPLLAGVPVIIITAQPARVPKTLPPTVRAVLEKPLQLATLIGLIRDICSTVVRSGVPQFAAGTGNVEQREIVPEPAVAPAPAPAAPVVAAAAAEPDGGEDTAV